MEWGTGPSIETKEESISVVECTYRCLVFSINVHPHPFIFPALQHKLMYCCEQSEAVCKFTSVCASAHVHLNVELETCAQHSTI